MKKIGISVLLSSLCGVMPALAQSPDLLVCSDKGYTLTSTTAASGTSAVTYQWFENGTAINNSNSASYSVAANTKAAGVYSYVRKVSNTACTDVSSNTFTVQVLKPAAPTVSVLAAAVCEGANVVFGIVPAANTTYTWSGVSGGATSGSGNSTYTLTSPATGTKTAQAKASTAYTVGSLNKTCESALSTAASAVVNPLPVVTPSGTFARCGSGTLTLGVNVTLGGTVTTTGLAISWYSNSAGTGTALTTGASYTTPSLTASQTYYAKAVVSATSCASATTTPVAATINLYEGAISGQEN
jgi:hypothetical protein